LTEPRLEPALIDSAGNKIFVLLRAPELAEKCVVFVPPFAEEMNKCRRQVTDTAIELANAGLAVLTVDLVGTGDSELDFADASWLAWQDDLEVACRWVEAKGIAVRGLVAVRVGCCLAASALARHKRQVGGAVLWQPVEDGRRYMSQFLRLRVANSLMDKGAGETTDGLRNRLRAGESLEIAGYSLSPRLWREIESARLEPSMLENFGAVSICEVGPGISAELSAVSRKLAAGASSIGVDVSGERYSGDPYWSATELVVNGNVRQHTVQHLTSVIQE